MHAQGDSATLSGTVKDAAGDVLADASVTVTNIATNVASKAKTSSSGTFLVVNLRPGQYLVETEAPGFQKSVQSVILETGQRGHVDITLSVGGLTETVVVTGIRASIVSNLTLYYEKSGFSSRASRRQRSDFVGEITGFGADRALRFVSGEAVIDMQVGYTVGKGRLQGLGLLLQAYNVTDSSYRTYRQIHDQIEEFQRYGRTFLLGLNYRLGRRGP